MTTCVELGGVVAVATVATSSMVLCGTANVLQALKGQRVARPNTTRSVARSIEDGPRLKAQPDTVKCFIDGKEESGHVGFDGEVFFHSRQGTDWGPKMAVSGATITEEGDTITIEHSVPRKVLLKFSKSSTANQRAWRAHLSLCKDLSNPYVRINELRDYTSKQEKVIEALTSRVGNLVEETEKLEEYREKYEKMSEGMRGRGEKEVEEGVSTAAYTVEGRKVMEDAHGSLLEKISFLEQEIPAKHRALEEMHDALHQRIQSVEGLDSFPMAPAPTMEENARLQQALQAVNQQKDQIEAFSRVLEQRVLQLENKLMLENGGQAGMVTDTVRQAREKATELEVKTSNLESRLAFLETIPKEASPVLTVTENLRDGLLNEPERLAAMQRTAALQNAVVTEASSLDSRLTLLAQTSPRGAPAPATRGLEMVPDPNPALVQKLEEAEAKRMQLQATVDELTSRLQNAEALANSAMAQGMVPAQDHEELQRTLQNYEAEVQREYSKLSDECQNLQRANEAYRETQTRLERELALIQQPRSPLQDPQVPLLMQDVEDLKAKVAEREKQRDDAQMQLSSLTRDIEGVRTSHRGLEQQMSEQARMLEIVQGERRSFEQKAIDLELSMQAAQARPNEDMLRLQEAHDIHYNRVQVLQQEMEALVSKNRELDTKHRELETLSAGRTSESSAQIFSLQQRAMTSESRVAELEAQLAAADQLKAMLESKAANVESAKATISQLEMLLDMEKKKSGDVDTMMRSKDIEVSDLKQALKTKDQMLDRMKGEISDLQRLQSTISDKERYLSQLQDDRDVLAQENTNLRSAYDELKAAYETTVQSPAPLSPTLSESQGDQLLISKLTEQNSDLKNQLELTWKKINEQTKRIEEERTAFWEELEQVRQKTGAKPPERTPMTPYTTTTGVPGVSKPPTISTNPPARSGLLRSPAEGQQRSAGTDNSPYSTAKVGNISASKYNIPSRTSGAALRGASYSTPDGLASRPAVPAYSGAAARPGGMTYAQTAAVSGRPISGETVRAISGAKYEIPSRYA